MSGERTPGLEPTPMADAVRAAAASRIDVTADAAPAAEPASASAPTPAPASPRIDVPGEDVDLAVDVTALPGAHRGGYSRAMTAPVDVPLTATEPVRIDAVQAEIAQSRPLRLAPWALLFAVLALAVALVVGWGFLIGILGAVLALVALRRPWESRGLAVWALCLSVASLLYSAGWLWWASTQGPLFG
ncbi:hypothetical protein [Microbacterium telephonicum]|uniref:Uncharacterized protein n=1 Tax=Microbacterium telephonicum TaxID=1714841 RepID=A0A498C5N2_9MICO|nr:hypothetical protein [Microbacterium telephonicum]RLK47928.1 hypothetical protein C7474_2527 [Microbacterium telephonicum]